jgi:hypothetical protein
MSGWIKIHRSITDHWLYTEKRCFSKFEAWNDILLTVNYSESKIIIKGKIYEIKRGESILSFESWGKRWNWDKSKVRRFFNLLQSDKMILFKCDNITTHLTVCNYGNYQSTGNTDETQTKHESNTDETQMKPKGNTSEFQTKPIKESKEEEEQEEEQRSKKEKFDFLKSCISYGFEKDLVFEWLAIRKAKGGINTKTAFDQFIKQVEKTNKNKNEILTIIIGNSWKGFNAEWLNNNTNNNGKQFTKLTADEQLAKRFAEIDKKHGINQEQDVSKTISERTIFDDYEEIP